MPSRDVGEVGAAGWGMSILPPHLSRQERRAAIKALERDNRAAPAIMRELPEDRWPTAMREALCKVWRSSRFFAQLYAEPNDIFRLSVNRTSTPDGDRWTDGITWDELQSVKAQCGFAGAWAVEVFPPTDCVVNVANVRHLWLLPEAPKFAWRQQ